MRKILNKKGGFPVVIIVIAAVIVVGALIFGAFNGFGFGGGQGDGEGAGNVTSAAETEPETLPVIEEIEFLNVTVSENEYLYQNSKLPLDELIEKLRKDADGTRVKVADENASKRAYNNLINALKENGISFVEAN